MKKQSVYLAGGMEGLTKDQMTGWREEASEYFRGHEIATLDPTRRVAFHNGDMDRNACRRIVKMDYQDIANSKVILADLRADQPGMRWGTVAELAHSHTKNKIIVAWTGEQDSKHPFIEFFATEIHHNLPDACAAVKEYYQ